MRKQPNKPFKFREGIGRAMRLPAYAPNSIPKAHKIPALKSTWSRFQYSRKAPSPIGGNNMKSEVPCAVCWSMCNR